MSAIASLEDLKAAQENLLEAKDLHELKAIFKKWRSGQWTKKECPGIFWPDSDGRRKSG
jgi:hypothetical protein